MRGRVENLCIGARLDPSAHSASRLCAALRHAADEAFLLRGLLGLDMDRLLVARDVVVLVRLDALFMVLRLLLYLFLGDYLLAPVHAGGLIEAVRKAERPGVLVLDDSLILESVVAPAVSGVARGVAHSN